MLGGLLLIVIIAMIALTQRSKKLEAQQLSSPVMPEFKNPICSPSLPATLPIHTFTVVFNTDKGSGNIQFDVNASVSLSEVSHLLLSELLHVQERHNPLFESTEASDRASNYA